MPNNEVIHQGKTLGYISNKTEFKENDDGKHLILKLEDTK